MNRVSKIIYRVLIILALLGLWQNTIFYINMGIEMTYQREHPDPVCAPDSELTPLEIKLKRYYYISLGIYLFCFTVIGYSIYKLNRIQKRVLMQGNQE